MKKSKEDRKIIRDFKSLNKEQRSAIMMFVFALRKIDLLGRKQALDNEMEELENRISAYCWTRPKFSVHRL